MPKLVYKARRVRRLPVETFTGRVLRAAEAKATQARVTWISRHVRTQGDSEAVYQDCMWLPRKTHTTQRQIKDKGVTQYAREHVAILLSLLRTMLPPTHRQKCLQWWDRAYEARLP